MFVRSLGATLPEAPPQSQPEAAASEPEPTSTEEPSSTTGPEPSTAEPEPEKMETQSQVESEITKLMCQTDSGVAV